MVLVPARAHFSRGGYVVAAIPTVFIKAPRFVIRMFDTLHVYCGITVLNIRRLCKN